MSHTDRLKQSPDTFRPLTGITPAAFDRLLTQLAPRHQQAEARRKDRPGRRRKPGAGRKHTLPLADRLLMLLIYYRTYVPHTFLGFLFGLDDSAVCRNVNPLQPLLAGIFRIPERRVALAEEDVRELFFDATERPTRRPKRRQRACYSGKKKRHTLKVQVVVARRRKRPGRGPSRGGCASPPCPAPSRARPMTRGCTTRRACCARRGCGGRGTRGTSGRGWRRRRGGRPGAA
jgi:hypothetical protein